MVIVTGPVTGSVGMSMPTSFCAWDALARVSLRGCRERKWSLPHEQWHGNVHQIKANRCTITTHIHRYLQSGTLIFIFTFAIQLYQYAQKNEIQIDHTYTQCTHTYPSIHARKSAPPAVVLIEMPCQEAGKLRSCQSSGCLRSPFWILLPLHRSWDANPGLGSQIEYQSWYCVSEWLILNNGLFYWMVEYGVIGFWLVDSWVIQPIISLFGCWTDRYRESIKCEIAFVDTQLWYQ